MRAKAFDVLRGDHDLSTPEGRGRERWRRIALAALGASGFRVVTMAGTLVTVPLIIAYAGNDGFGLFSVVTTLVTMLAFSDLGIGNGLVTALGQAHGRGDAVEQRRLVSSAGFLLVVVATLFGVLFALVLPLIDWAAVFGVDGDRYASQARPAVAVFAVGFVLGIPAIIGQKVHLALQQGLSANLWSLAAAVLTVALTLVCVMLKAPVPWLIGASVGATTLVYAIDSLVLFGRHRPDLAPRRQDVDFNAVRTLARMGGLFSLLVAAAAVGYQTDAVVISVILGAAAVTAYAVPLRLFGVPMLVITALLTPLWPAYGEAMARGDLTWLRSALYRSLCVAAAVSVPCAALLVLFGQPIVHAWVGKGVTPSYLLLISMGLWTVLYGLLQPLAMLLNGAGVIRFQVIAALSMAGSNVVLSIALTHWLGVAGPVLGSVMAGTVCSLIPSLIVVRRLLAGHVR